MKTEKFELLISGIELNPEQRAQVAAQLNVALISAMFGDAPNRIKGPVWSRMLRNGGWVITAELAKELEEVAQKNQLGG